MADAKISALTSVTTPLAGTEVLPVVQSSSTKKVTVANLTAGRAVTADSLSVGTTDVFAKVGAQRSGGNSILARFNSSNKPAGIYTGGSSGESFIGANLEWSSGNVFNYKLNGMMWYLGDPGGGGTSVVLGIGSGTAGNTAGVDSAATVRHRWDTSGNYTVTNGNVVIGTSGKGIDFSATANGSGTMSGELFDDYEWGYFTPNIEGSVSAGTGTYVYRIGRYTKVGNRVMFNIMIDWSGHTGTGFLRVTGLPFTSFASAPYYHGVAVGYADAIATTAGTMIHAFVPNNTTQIYIGEIPTGGGTFAYVAMDAAGTLVLSGQYEV